MSKDMKKKIGKRGLSGLLNTGEEENNAAPGFDDYPYSGSRPSRFPRSTGGAYRGPNSFAQHDFGSRLGGAQSNPHVPPFVVEDDEALFSEAQLRRITLDIGEELRRALRKYDMNVSFGKEKLLRDLIEELLICGDVRISIGQGNYLTVNILEEWAEDDDDEGGPFNGL